LGKDEKVLQQAEDLYKELTQKGIEVLYDDREDVSAGEKFADSDLMGIPFRVIISNRTVTEGGYELKKRTEEKERIVKREELFKL
jgi:prolyl-tRNA synthetase